MKNSSVIFVFLCLMVLLSGCGKVNASTEDIAELIPQLIVADDQMRINAEQKLEALQEVALPALEEILQDQDEDLAVLRGIVARFLARIDSPQVQQILIDTVYNDLDEFVRTGAILSLEQLGSADSEVIEAYRSALFDPSDDVKVAAANALQKLGESASEAGIDLLLFSGSSNIRFGWAARTAATKVSPGIFPLKEESILAIIDRLPSLQWQELAMTVLAREAASYPYVLDLAFNKDTKVSLRVPALKILQRKGITDSEVLERLNAVSLDETESFLVRLTVQNIIGDFDNPLANYVNDHKIVIQVENFATEDRENVAVQVVLGFPEKYQIKSSSNLVLTDENQTQLYSDLKALKFWDQEEQYIRMAELTFYPDLAAQALEVFMLDLMAENDQLDRPASISATGQVRASIAEQGLGIMNEAGIELGEGWMMQLVVDLDGSGTYTSVQDAIDAIPVNSQNRTIIYIKEGLYHEKLLIPANKQLVTFIGESRTGTILDFNETPQIRNSPRSFYNTHGSASTIILANDFVADNLTFNNSALQGTGQALAVSLKGDRMIFTNCNFISHQDTVFADNNGRQYFYNCYIEGDVDFIFGSAIAVFENCDLINVRKTGGYITAASTPEDQEFGLVFINSRIGGDVNQGSVWLGRPWRPYSHTAFINCYMSEVVQPTGWHNWGNVNNESTARYLEYNSYGPGANPNGRVSWSRQLTDEEAQLYTVENIFKGNDGWNPKVY